jgi:hypothetical protein
MKFKILILFSLFLTTKFFSQDLNDLSISTAEISTPSDFPGITVLESNSPSDGYIYLANMWNGASYIMIVDQEGKVVYYKKTPVKVYDFKRHPNGCLSYCLFGNGIKKFMIMDSTFTVIDSLYTFENYPINEHELLILENGNYLFATSEYKRVNLSLLVEGGNSNALIRGHKVWELDNVKNVIFEWSSLDYFNILDAFAQDFSQSLVDIVHLNTIEVDLDGNLLLSSRNLCEITKIDRITGQIIWRLGGKNNQFKYVDDPYLFEYDGTELSFSFQHSIRVLPNGNYILFDNGNLRNSPFSRAVEYKLDATAKTAQLVWQYDYSKKYYSSSWGSVQRLDNSNTLIGWAASAAPKVTEVNTAGNILLEIDFSIPCCNYRAFKSDWMGEADKPYLVAEPHYNNITLIFNHFGKPDVNKYIIYSGTQEDNLKMLKSVHEPFLVLDNLQNFTEYYFAVSSVDAYGIESGLSNCEKVFVHFIDAGENIILNGDFTEGTDYWTLATDGSGQASYNTNQNGKMHISINDPGREIYDVQLRQNNIILEHGMKYRFEFDAYASKQRFIDVSIHQTVESHKHYSQIGTIFLAEYDQHYQYEFENNDLTDFTAEILFEMGAGEDDIFIDNVSLIDIGTPSALNPDSSPNNYFLSNNYPNPFNPSTFIEYYLENDSYVKLDIYNILGELIQTLVNNKKIHGDHIIKLEAGNLSSGIYFYKLTAKSVDENMYYTDIKKMILLK